MKTKLMFFLAFFTTILLGAYKDSGMKKWKQPNGIEFTARLWGDEFENQMETNNGYRIAKGTDGYYYYAILDVRGEFSPSNNKVGIDQQLPSSYKLQRSAARIRELQEAFRKAQDS